MSHFLQQLLLITMVVSAAKLVGGLATTIVTPPLLRLRFSTRHVPAVVKPSPTSLASPVAVSEGRATSTV